MQISRATDFNRPFAASQLAEMPQSNRPFRPPFEGRQSDVDFEDRSTSFWPAAGAAIREIDAKLLTVRPLGD
jgi:hypothetical protein